MWFETDNLLPILNEKKKRNMKTMNERTSKQHFFPFVLKSDKILTQNQIGPKYRNHIQY